METTGYPQTESLVDPLAHINRDQLAAMADAAVADQTEFNTSAPSSPTQKRKRSAPDSSPDSRRSKRSAPAASTMSSTPDAASAAYVESAVEAAQAAAQAANVNADLGALEQSTTDHPDSADPANASSTAAAALGTMYPILHIPQPTEETFAAQTAAAETEQHHQATSFASGDAIPQSDGLPDLSTTDNQQTAQNGIRASHSYSTPVPLSHKPAVGSEEWHKMRKDNHKEGKPKTRWSHLPKLKH